MFDSMGVRRQSGEQGILLNQLVVDFHMLSKKVVKLSHDSAALVDEQTERHLKEYLGHKPIEVFFGILTGILVAFATQAILTYFSIL